MTVDSFYELFDSMLPKCNSVEEAYEEAEKIHEKELNIRRYNSYSTFRAARSRHFKKRRKRVTQ